MKNGMWEDDIKSITCCNKPTELKYVIGDLINWYYFQCKKCGKIYIFKEANRGGSDD